MHSASAPAGQTPARAHDPSRLTFLPARARLFRGLVPIVAILAATAAAQEGPPPHAGPGGVFGTIDRIAIVFPSLEADAGAGAPTVSARVQWIEGPFVTPVMAGPGGNAQHQTHLTIAVDDPRYYRWDGPIDRLPEYLPADITRDGVVDIADFSALVAAWGHNQELPPLPLPPQ